MHSRQKIKYIYEYNNNVYINIYHLVFYVLYFLNQEGTPYIHTLCIMLHIMHTGGTYLRISCYRSITEGGNIC